MKKLICAILVLATTGALTAKIVTQRIPYEHEGVKLEGYLAYDEAKASAGKLPGVLVIHEWWGLNAFAEAKAVELAKLGYVAFALDMYGAGLQTLDSKQAGAWAAPFYNQPLLAPRARAGLDQLLATGLVNDKKVAAIGFCFGGTAAMALAYSGAPLAGIVSFHGGVLAASAEDAARTKAKFLICHGAADPFTPKEQLDRFLVSLDEGKIDYQFIVYSGAQHAFTNPRADELAEVNHLTGIRYDAAAARRSWAHMRVFFEELFRE